LTGWASAMRRAVRTVIIVLGARVEADGRSGSDLTSRITTRDLWQAGYAPFLICMEATERAFVGGQRLPPFRD